MTDIDPHTNPAFCAVILSWMADGYARHTPNRAGTTDGMNPAFAIVGLSLVCSSSTRKFLKSPTKDLARLGSEVQEWRIHTEALFRSWSGPFWQAANYGNAHGLLILEAARLCPAKAIKPDTDALKAVKQAANSFGGIIAKSFTDSLRWKKLMTAVAPTVDNQVLEIEK